MNKQADIWRKKTEEAILVIDELLYGTKKDYDLEFQRVIVAVFETDENPYGFMPSGWEGVKGNAQEFENFLHTVHHAMVDDGDICFIKRRDSVYMMFIDRWETDKIQADMDKKYFNSTVEWEETTPTEFINSLS